MARSGRPKFSNLIKRLRSIKAKDIMTKYIITTTESATLAEIAELMVKTRISGLPVLGKKGRITGIVTAEDLFLVMDMIESGDAAENGAISASNPTAKFAMSTEIHTIKKNTTLNEIITLMKYRNIHTIPVMEGNKMVGIVGRRDVFKNFYAVVKNL